MYWLPRARITSASCPRRLARTVETPGGLPDAAHMHREAPSALSVTFFGAGPIFRLFSASGAIECRLREALRVKTWCRRSRRRHSHLPRGRGNYGCHRSRPRWGSLTDRFQSQSRVLAIAVGPKLLVTIEQTQNLLLGFSQKVVNHVPVTSRAHGATTCLSRTIMCHTLLHNNSSCPSAARKSSSKIDQKLPKFH